MTRATLVQASVGYTRLLQAFVYLEISAAAQVIVLHADSAP